MSFRVGAFTAVLDVLSSEIYKRATVYSEVSDRFEFILNLTKMEVLAPRKMRQAAEKLVYSSDLGDTFR